jgi:SAM-dependent methyltransferase
MGFLVKVKRRFFDEHRIAPVLYSPLIYWLFLLNPFRLNGRVEFPSLSKLESILTEIQDIEVRDYFLDRSDLEHFMSENIHEYFPYFSTGYGQMFVGKAAEHLVSLRLSRFSGGTFIDIAASLSPFSKIVKRIFPQAKVYRQDLAYRPGVYADQIGGDAANLPLENGSVDLMTLHNSIEHFEGDSDTAFIMESSRILKRGGEVVILPLFLENEHINYIDPTINPNGLKIDREAKVIYAYSQSRFMRHYSAKTFRERLLNPAREDFSVALFKIRLSHDLEEKIELALALRLTRL